MRVTYKVLSLWEAQEGDYPYHTPWEELEGEELDGSGIWRCEDGIPVEFIGEDGGEPEDQLLYRNWSWVSGALQAAYQRGREDVLVEDQYDHDNYPST